MTARHSATPIGIAGAGLIGRRHAAALGLAEGVHLAGVADPAEAGRSLAAEAGVPWFASLDEMLDSGIAAGIILATPNQLHAGGALACIGAGIPVLVEKPLTDSVADGEALVRAAAEASVAVLTGHHRRHNPLIEKAKSLIAAGTLGRLTAVHAQAWFMKPDAYFETAWRREEGAGPVFLNLIHDIDILHYLCGPIVAVTALESNAVRGHPVEETAVILLRFASGLLGTASVCDAAVAPWSWELTARENPAYPATDESCCWIAGTRASLALPGLALWRHEGEQSWWQPIGATRMPVGLADPLVRQAAHFGRVIRGEEAPLVTARDGLRALMVVEAVKRSAAGGGLVAIAPPAL